MNCTSSKGGCCNLRDLLSAEVTTNLDGHGSLRTMWDHNGLPGDSTLTCNRSCNESQPTTIPRPAPFVVADLFEFVGQIVRHVQNHWHFRIGIVSPNRISILVDMRIVIAAVQQPPLDSCGNFERQSSDRFDQRLELRTVVADGTDVVGRFFERQLGCRFARCIRRIRDWDCLLEGRQICWWTGYRSRPCHRVRARLGSEFPVSNRASGVYRFAACCSRSTRCRASRYCRVRRRATIRKKETCVVGQPPASSCLVVFLCFRKTRVCVSCGCYRCR